MLFRSGLFCFENRKEIFEGVDSRFKFVVLTFAKGGGTSSVPTAFMRHDVMELARFPKEGALDISVELIKRLSPDSLSVMEFKNEMAVRIAEKMLRFPLLGERLAGSWNLVLCTEFHMTGDSKIFSTSEKSGVLMLYEWKIFNKFYEGLLNNVFNVCLVLKISPCLVEHQPIVVIIEHFKKQSVAFRTEIMVS